MDQKPKFPKLRKNSWLKSENGTIPDLGLGLGDLQYHQESGWAKFFDVIKKNPKFEHTKNVI